MNIFLAEFSGFCFGVKRAIQMALEAASQGGKVCTLGEIIHNPVIVNQFKSKGVEVCEHPEKIHNQTVILRSHGVTKQVLEILIANGNRIVDASCPYVLRAQKLAESMSQEGYQVIILGDEKHPEVIGIRSWAGSDAIILSAESRPDMTFGQKLSLICQTTEKQENLAKLVAWLAPQAHELRIFNTICLATQQRQEASRRLAQFMPLVIVIGGLNSSNTRQLHRLCSLFSRCFWIEDEQDLKPQWFDDGSDVGLAAGASTPAETIIAVYNKIKEINGESGRVTAVGEIPLFKEESC